MIAPEGSEERIQARHILVRSALAALPMMSYATWLERIVKIAPALVATVGVDELERIANYAWSARLR